MDLEAVYPKPRTSVPGPVEQRYPYLLRGMSIDRCNQVWSCDITYIRLQSGFIYLMAVIDSFSRYVLSWEVSITLDTEFLSGSAGASFAHRHARDFQHGSRVCSLPVQSLPIGSKLPTHALAGMAEDGL